MSEDFEQRIEEVQEIKEKGELTFRDLRIEDCEAMLAIRNSVVAELGDQGVNYGNGKIVTIDEWRPKFQERLNESLMVDGLCVAAEDDGNLVGWMMGRKSPREENIPTAEIGDAVLGKKARGFKNFTGLSKVWVEKAKEKWGVKKLRAWTSTKNRARNLYKRFGFTEIEIIPGKEHEDYVELEKILD